MNGEHFKRPAELFYKLKESYENKRNLMVKMIHFAALRHLLTIFTRLISIN